MDSSSVCKGRSSQILITAYDIAHPYLTWTRGAIWADHHITCLKADRYSPECRSILADRALASARLGRLKQGFGLLTKLWLG